MMKAMILAAGKGTRLMPVTKNKPKALVEVGGMTLLESLLKKMKAEGIRQIIINIHHFPRQIRDFLEKNQFFGMDISFSDESDELLDTGGGLMKASWFFDDRQPFLLHNVDVISDIHFGNLLDNHKRSDALATLAVSRRNSSRYLLIDRSGAVRGWKNMQTGEQIPRKGAGIEIEQVAFSGIHVISPEIFGLIRQTGRFSMIEAYLSLADTGRIRTYIHDAEGWFDAGKVNDLKIIEQKLAEKGRKN